MTQPTSFACLATALLGLTFSLPALAQQNVEVVAQDGLLSVRASNTSASQLAETLSEQLGISIVVTGDTEALVNIDIVEEPLEKALSKLSPNNMLIRSGKERDSDIVEVILMMGEGSDGGSSAGSEQFLPSGSPAEEVYAPTEQGEVQADDGGVLRDPNRSQDVRDAANAAANDAQPGGSPEAQGFDPVTGFPIDPVTGVPIDPATGLPVE